MIFNVATLLSKNIGETRKHSFKLENFSAEKQNFIDIVCQITMIKTHKNILVYGEIGAKYKDYCDRCLQSIIMNLETYFEEEFIFNVYPLLDGVVPSVLAKRIRSNGSPAFTS